MTDLPDTLSPTLAARAALQDTSLAMEPVVGEWDDAQWRQVAAQRVRTPAEQKFVAAGPRAHPFGPDAVVVRDKDKPVHIFASEGARKVWQAAHPEKPAPRPAMPPAAAPAPAAILPAA